MSAKQLSLREKRRLRRQTRRSFTTVLFAAGGVLLVVAVGFYWAGRRDALAAFDYAPEDVSNDQPLHAVHEMGSGGPIPFLPRGDPQPEIALEDRFHDFGVIGGTEIVSREFVIANVGEAPLTISRAYTTCGCTTADFTASVIQPGQVSLVTVELDAGFHDVRGQTVRRGVIIESNDPNHSTVEIWIQATVR